MNRFFKIFLTFASVLILTSCANEDFLGFGNEGISFTLSLPQGMLTRGVFGDGSDPGDHVLLDSLRYAVFEVDEDGDLSDAPVIVGAQDASPGNGGNILVSLNLLKGKRYQVAFYAEDSSNEFASFSEGDLIVDYTKAISNTAASDVFVGRSEIFTVGESYNSKVTLTRPFSQLNWGTNDLEEPQIKGMLDDLEAFVSITSGLYTRMNVITGEPEETSAVSEAIRFPEVEFNKLPSQAFPIENHSLIAMNYLLTGDGSINCKLEYSLKSGGAAPNTVEVNSAPMKKNQRTNIYGALLCAPQNFQIEVSYGFNETGQPENPDKPDEPKTPEEQDPSKDLPKWDGKTLTAVTPETETIDGITVYSISNGEELAWLAEQLNSTGSDVQKNIYIRLNSDIDLDNQPFTPLCNTTGTSMTAMAFKGVFDGQGHTIYNLNVDNSSSNFGSALIGHIHGGSVMNLNIHGGSVKGNNCVGSIVGYINVPSGKTSTISNCTLTGVTLTLSLPDNTTSAYYGTVGGFVGRAMINSTSYPALTITNCSTDDTVKIYIDGNNNKAAAGGIIGAEDPSNKKIISISDCINRSTIQGPANIDIKLDQIIGSTTTNVTITGCAEEGKLIQE